MTGLWLARSRGSATVRSGASTPGAARGEESRRRCGAPASRTRSRTPPPRPRAAASRTPPPKPLTRKRAATDRRERAAAEAPLCASTPERVRPPWPRRDAVRRHEPDLHALVGRARETAEDHEARHPGYGHYQTCPRCRFYKIGPSWVSAYGTVSAPGHGPDQVQWLAERPSHWGGPWALGCTICAHAMGVVQQQPDASSGAATTPAIGASTPAVDAAMRRRRRGGTMWTRFEVRSRFLMSESIRSHAGSEQHKRAVACYMAPHAPVRIRTQSTEDDELLLMGAVPQPCDWLRAWQCCKNPSSWQATADRAGTEHFISQIRSRPPEPKAFQAMVRCMGEVLRREKRRWMLGATSIFLTFDDKAGRKLLRFKCDTPVCSDAKGKDGDIPVCFDAKGKDEPTMLSYGARHGIVGCMPMRVGTELSHYEEDYAERTKNDIVALLRRMLTPAGESCDDASTLEVFQKVRGVCVDGQLLKTAQVMQQAAFPNIVIIMRDPAHIIRISCRDPLHDADIFSEQYERLFSRRHAVLKDIQNSNVWKEQFMACQRQILAEGGELWR